MTILLLFSYIPYVKNSMLKHVALQHDDQVIMWCFIKRLYCIFIFFENKKNSKTEYHWK